MKSLLDHEAANLTSIQLEPLDEATVIDFVSTSLGRPKEHILPLAIVCLEKTNGNPFYLKQMLEICHRRGAIWYSWTDGCWQYDLDRVFAEFASPEYGQQLDNNFIIKRLQELPAASRSILAWASLIGINFSFTLLHKILSGDYWEANSDQSFSDCPRAIESLQSQDPADLVEGLEAALQAYVLVPGGNEDEYCFSHDRYLRAATHLQECSNTSRMHFVIAQIMMKTSNKSAGNVYTIAQHLSKAADMLKAQVNIRKPYRAVLLQAANRAVQSGARPTALQFYENCLELLQSDPWHGKGPDVNYEETLDVYTTAAELCWSQGKFEKSQKLLDNIFSNASESGDKSRAYIIQSRLLSREGNINAAMQSLKKPLRELGLDLAMEPTWEMCDVEYAKLKERLRRTNLKDLAHHPTSSDERVRSLGAVLLEAISAAFWSDSLLVSGHHES